MFSGNDFVWQTEQAHVDNYFTLCDYLENEMDVSWQVQWIDGTQAEIMTDTGALFLVNAMGNGDAFNHRVIFTAL